MKAIPKSYVKRRRGLLMVGLLTLVLAGLLAVISAGWNLLAARLESRHKVPVGPYTQEVPSRTGSIHGVRLNIPEHYLFFPVEYDGESVWTPGQEQPVRTFDSQISNFAVYVQWPEFKPRLPDNEKSYLASLREPGAHDWFRVALVARNFKPSSSADTQKLAATPQVDNGLARILNGYLNHPERYGIPKGIHYEVIMPDVQSGLNPAIPIGPGAEKSRIWNKALYWEGDRDHRVNSLIECGHGALPDPRD